MHAVTCRCAKVSEGTVLACCFSPCGQMFVTGSTLGELHLWTRTVRPLHTQREAHDLGVNCCHFSPQMSVGKTECCRLFYCSLCWGDVGMSRFLLFVPGNVPVLELVQNNQQIRCKKKGLHTGACWFSTGARVYLLYSPIEGVVQLHSVTRASILREERNL